jgi:uncharacterized protein (TIGR03083 family)
VTVPFDHAEYCDLASGAVTRMADVVRGADMSTPVPTCPDWDLADLVRHVARVNRWAATMVRELSQERLDRRAMTDLEGPDDVADLADWLAEGATVMDDAFRGVDPDAAMWSWGADRHARFWPRRMVHEIGVHRADAELALGGQPTYDPAVAGDGIDELLDNLPHAEYFAPKVAELRGNGERLALVASDGGAWLIELGPDGYTWWASAAPDPAATATVTAPAAELLLVLFGRRPLGAVTGNRALVEHWLANSSL